MLLIQNLCVSHPPHEIIKKLHLSLPTGQVHGLVGLNGAGKTTLFNAIYGLTDIDQGEILLNSQPLKKNQMAFLQTANFFYSHITGQEYLDLFRLKNPAFEVERWNTVFELPLHQLVETYSTGMKKKLAFMGILCLDRPLLLLDEPFNGLDMESNQQLKIILQALKNKGKTLLITSHIMESLTSICDSISYLNNKQIEFTARPDNFALLEKRIFTNQQRIQSTIEELLGGAG